MRTPLTIIIPAKHEEHTIISTLEAIRRRVKTPHRVIVINISDRNDTTAGLVLRYKKTHPRVSLIRKITDHGTFGMPLIEGFRASRGYVIPVMADMCDNPDDIDTMYGLMERGWDVVSASRYMKGGRKIGGPALQSFFSRFVCYTLRLITGIPTGDISNAFKMYRTSQLSHVRISPEGGVEESMMIVLQLYFSGAKITELPTVWRGRTAGNSKFRLIERAPKYLQIYMWAVYKTLTQKRCV